MAEVKEKATDEGGEERRRSSSKLNRVDLHIRGMSIGFSGARAFIISLAVLITAWPAMALELTGVDDVTGFVEAAGGLRLRGDHYQGSDETLAELRLQVEAAKYFDWMDVLVKSDFYFDAVEDSVIVDLREANVAFSPQEMIETKLGRQVLTWGTGDLLFINDLFPKDWQSFFIGRDEEYLKSPSDALKLSLYPGFATVDFVYTPQFDPDRFIDGERLSYYNPMLRRRAGEDDRIHADEPDDWFEDDEFALRVSRNVEGYELALYGYYGFWKSPAGSDIERGKATFPRLGVYGASVRGPLGKGIANLEAGYYDSLDDRQGDDPFVDNSQLRFLAGYEREVVKDFTAGVQYYLEHIFDHSTFARQWPDPDRERDQNRHVVTVRLTRLLMQQNLQLSLFAYVSPSDHDSYLRPSVLYKLSDSWSVVAGMNVFWGEDRHTFFGQFEENNNAYVRVRYSF